MAFSRRCVAVACVLDNEKDTRFCNGFCAPSRAGIHRVHATSAALRRIVTPASARAALLDHPGSTSGIQTTESHAISRADHENRRRLVNFEQTLGIFGIVLLAVILWRYDR